MYWYERKENKNGREFQMWFLRYIPRENEEARNGKKSGSKKNNKTRKNDKTVKTLKNKTRKSSGFLEQLGF